LILCKIDKEIADQRNEFFEQQTPKPNDSCRKRPNA
jgi:hypothetical protein